MAKSWCSTLLAVGVTVGAFLAVRYLLPILLPFAIGLAFALCAEPMVKLFTHRFHLRRACAAAFAVSMAILFVLIALLLLGALLVRQVGALTHIVPNVEEMAKDGIASLSNFLQTLASNAPAGLGVYLSASISDFFSSGTALLDRVTGFLLNMAGGVLRQIPDGALGIGTALISAYMISAKLPHIREAVAIVSAKMGVDRLASSLTRMRSALWGWLRAQLRLSAITYVLVLLGLVLLRVPYAPVWAIMIAVVDAFPVLGTGTVLVPWSAVCFLQGSTARAIGLLGVYALVALVRSVLEPKLVGKQLGIDPLVTLLALYAGFQLWGIGGMILAPMLTAAVGGILKQE